MPRFYVTPTDVNNSASLNNIAASGYAQLGASNIFTFGGQVISNNASTTVPLVIRAATGQSTNILEIQSSASAISSRIDQYGQWNGTFLNISGDSPTNIMLRIRGTSGQTQDITQWQTSGGTVLSTVNASGQFVVGGSVAISYGSLATLSVYTGASTTPGIVIRGAASQSEALQRWIDSSGTSLADMSANGYLRVTRLYGNTGNGYIGAAGGNELIVFPHTSSNVVWTVRGNSGQSAVLQSWQNSTPTQVAYIDNGGSLGLSGTGTIGSGYISNTQFSVTSTSTSNIVGLFKASSGQTADLMQWQNNSGTILSAINNAGKFIVGSSAAIVAAGGSSVTLSLYSTAGDGNLAIKAAAGQSAPLTQWQDSGGTNILNITSGGILQVYRTAYFSTGNTANVPVKIQGIASQSANLIEWQNSSGSVLSAIDSSGALKFNDTTSLSNLTGAITASSGLFLLQSGTSSADTNAEMRIVRTGTINNTIANLRVYANTTTLGGALIATTGSFTSNASVSGDVIATGNVIYNQATNSQSSSAYSLALTDSGKFVEMTASVANTITVPASSTVAWAIGSRIDIVQYGAGVTTISPAASVTLRYYSPTSAATASIKGRYGAATLMYRAANEWVLVGNLT